MYNVTQSELQTFVDGGLIWSMDTLVKYVPNLPLGSRNDWYDYYLAAFNNPELYAVFSRMIKLDNVKLIVVDRAYLNNIHDKVGAALVEEDGLSTIIDGQVWVILFMDYATEVTKYLDVYGVLLHHELVHCKQMMDGSFYDINTNGAMWRGVHYEPAEPNEPEYLQLPWETEAYAVSMQHGCVNYNAIQVAYSKFPIKTQNISYSDLINKYW